MVLALGRLQAYGWHYDKHHSIPLCPLYDSRGDQLVAFPGFHALPGSDQTVTILCGKSKVLCWNTYKKTHKQVLEAFASLGSSMHFEDDMVMKLELYICAISMHLQAMGNAMVLVQQEAICRCEIATNKPTTLP